MSHHCSTKNGGFALVIALSLMSFVLLLLLSITTLVQVESRNAKGSTSQTGAQQNALLALNIAMGQLQKHTGPDQRTTALASLDDGDEDEDTTQPNWVGVWGNANVADYSQSPDSVEASEPVLLNWLVSGNEDATYQASIDAASFGQIETAQDEFEFEPTKAIAGIDDMTTALTEITINSQPAQLLVGGNSTNKENALTDYVAAPLVDIETSADTTTGRYAWWVGDEGVKTKISLRPSYLDQEGSDENEYQNFSFMTAQRSALEFVEFDDSGNMLDDDFDFEDPTLTKIQDLSTVSFLGTGAGDANKFQNLIQNRFHEVTAYGHGVLADSYAGGLKKDLTADFNGSLNRPADSTPIFTPLNTSDDVPTWGQARSLINDQLTPTTIDTGTTVPSSPPILPSDSNNGLYPVFSASSFGVDFYITGPYIADPLDPTVAFYQFEVAMVPLVVLWNPHTVAINATTYELGIRIHGENGESNVWVDFGGAEADVLNLHTGNWESDANINSEFLRFKINAETFAPGESQLYSLSSNGSIYSPGATLMTISDEGTDNYINHTTYTTENLRIPAEYTVGTDGIYTYSLPDGMDPRVVSQRPTFDISRSFDMVLAEEGGITTDSNQENWYHAVLDARLGSRGRNASDSRAEGGQVNVWLQSGSSGEYDAISDLLLTPDQVTSDNMSVFRKMIQMERRGGVATQSNRLGAMSWGNQNNAGRIRWLVHGNPRAKIVRNTKVENDKIGRGSILFASSHDVVGEDPLGSSFLFPFVSDTNGSRLSAGRGQGGGQNGYGIAALFDQLESTDNFLSLGQLQHSVFGSYGFYSSYQFGNSWADVRIARDEHHLPNHFKSAYAASEDQTLYDMSWHINRSVWDRYFVSTVPSSLESADVTNKRPLPNSRIDYYGDPDLDKIKGDDAYDEAAANLWVDGAFNINSTSEQAWRSLLSATFGIPDDSREFGDRNDRVSLVAPIPRFSRNQSQRGHNGVSFTNSMKGQYTGSSPSFNYVGNRGLSTTFNGVSNGTVEDLVAELARTIVNEVEKRGPFLSVGDFVNRAVTQESNRSDLDDIGIKGALQAAIDQMGMDENGQDDSSRPRINSREWQASSGTGLDGDDVWYMMEEEWNVEHFLGGPDRGVGNQEQMPYSVSAVGSPACMSPADLLTVIGPAISARSDTFRIRTYGETVNPVTNEVEGRAWCEAIAQRLPEYVENIADDPEVAPRNLTANSNAQFGRRYKIVSLRWLDPSEI